MVAVVSVFLSFLLSCSLLIGVLDFPAKLLQTPFCFCGGYLIRRFDRKEGKKVSGRRKKGKKQGEGIVRGCFDGQGVSLNNSGRQGNTFCTQGPREELTRSRMYSLFTEAIWQCLKEICL